MNHKQLQLFLFISIAIVYIALITFQPSLQVWPDYIIWFIDRQRLLELVLLGLILLNASLVNKTKQKTIIVSNAMRLMMLSLLIFSCFSCLLAYEPRHAMIEVSVFSALCYFALFIAQLYQEDSNLFIKRLTYIIWASVILYLLSFYTGYITATIVKKPLKWPFPFTGFSNIRSFNQYQLWTIGLLTVPLLLLHLRKSTRLLLHIALVAWWVLLYYSASRGVLVAWAGAIALTALAYKSTAWQFIKMQVSHMALGYLAFYVLFQIIPKTNESTIKTLDIMRTQTNDRLELWNQAILMIKSFPIFGAGPIHFAWHNKTNGHPHNSILQLASEWGIPATLIILSIGGYALYSWSKRFNLTNIQAGSALNQTLSIVLFFTIFANFAYSLVDGVIVMPISQVLMFTVIGLMIGQYTSTNASTIQQQSKLRPMLASMLLLSMIWSTYPEIKQGLSGDKKGFSLGHTAIGPRFWFETKVKLNQSDLNLTGSSTSR